MWYFNFELQKETRERMRRNNTWMGSYWDVFRTDCGLESSENKTTNYSKQEK